MSDDVSFGGLSGYLALWAYPWNVVLNACLSDAERFSKGRWCCRRSRHGITAVYFVTLGQHDLSHLLCIIINGKYAPNISGSRFSESSQVFLVEVCPLSKIPVSNTTLQIFRYPDGPDADRHHLHVVSTSTMRPLFPMSWQRQTSRVEFS